MTKRNYFLPEGEKLTLEGPVTARLYRNGSEWGVVECGPEGQIHLTGWTDGTEIRAISPDMT